jgi:hypothetical protein
VGAGRSPATIRDAQVTWNYTAVLNNVFLALAAILVWPAATTGGFGMLRMMNMSPQSHGARHHDRPRHIH